MFTTRGYTCWDRSRSAIVWLGELTNFTTVANTAQAPRQALPSSLRLEKRSVEPHILVTWCDLEAPARRESQVGDGCRCKVWHVLDMDWSKEVVVSRQVARPDVPTVRLTHSPVAQAVQRLPI